MKLNITENLHFLYVLRNNHKPPQSNEETNSKFIVHFSLAKNKKELVVIHWSPAT